MKNKFLKVLISLRGFLFNLRTKNKLANKTKIFGKVTLRFNPKLIIGENCCFYKNVILWGPGTIKLGNNCAIGDNTIIYSSNDGGVTIGSNSLIAANCYIIDSDHGTKMGQLIKSQEMNVKPIRIGDNVWIGTNSTILKGVVIGDGAVVGANSLVNKNVKENHIVGGVPAKTIKIRG